MHDQPDGLMDEKPHCAVQTVARKPAMTKTSIYYLRQEVWYIFLLVMMNRNDLFSRVTAVEVVQWIDSIARHQSCPLHKLWTGVLIPITLFTQGPSCHLSSGYMK